MPDHCHTCEPGALLQYLNETVTGVSIGTCQEHCSEIEGNYIATNSSNGNQICRKCDDPCLTCAQSGVSNCKSCKTDRVLQPNTANNEVGQCLEGCSPRYQIVNNASLSKVCHTCHVSCLSCTVPGDPDKCMTCDSTSADHKYLQEIETNSGIGKCQSECWTHYYKDNGSATDLRCSPCNETCHNCSAGGGNHCLNCPAA